LRKVHSPKEGLLKADSQRGVWEISDKGREVCLDKGNPPRVPSQRPPHRGTKVLGLLDNFKHKKPVAYSFLNEQHEVSAFKEVLLGICEAVHDRHRANFQKVLSLSGFSQKPRDLGSTSDPREVGRSGIYVATNLSANDSMAKCHKLLDLFGHSASEVDVEVRAR